MTEQSTADEFAAAIQPLFDELDKQTTQAPEPADTEEGWATDLLHQIANDSQGDHHR